MNFNEFVKDDFLKLNFKIINVSELVSFLKINPNITKLSVQGCAINDEEVEALASKKLPQPVHLFELIPIFVIGKTNGTRYKFA